MIKSLEKFRSEIMGICIIWIMFFHSTIEAPENIILRIFWYLTISFGGGIGVNIFLILSGFGLTYSSLKNKKIIGKKNLKKYYQRRIFRIIPIYFIVSGIFYGITCSSLKDFFYNLFFLNFLIEGKRDFWYILMILICYILFPIFIFFKEKINFRFLLLGFIILGQVIIYIISIYNPIFFKNVEIALYRFSCFWIGCYFGMLSFNKKEREYLIFNIVLIIIGIYFWIQYGFIRNVFVLCSPSIILIFCFLLEKLNIKIMKRMLNYFGEISLELYLIHVSLGSLISEYIFLKIPIFYLKLFTYFIISIVLSSVLYILKEKCNKKLR